MIDRGEGLLDGVFVLSVEIAAGQVTPRVADNHSVRVEHRNYLEDEQPPQGLGGLGVAGQVVENTSHHPGGGRLSGVNPGSDDDSCNGNYSQFLVIISYDAISSLIFSGIFLIFFRTGKGKVRLKVCRSDLNYPSCHHPKKSSYI